MKTLVRVPYHVSQVIHQLKRNSNDWSVNYRKVIYADIIKNLRLFEYSGRFDDSRYTRPFIIWVRDFESLVERVMVDGYTTLDENDMLRSFTWDN